MTPLACLFCADDFCDAEKHGSGTWGSRFPVRGNAESAVVYSLDVAFSVASITAAGGRSCESSNGQGRRGKSTHVVQLDSRRN